MAEIKAVLIVCDGLADRPVKELGGKTPLEAADKPSMDELSKLGVNGIMDVIAPGIPPGSDTAHLALFGYDPFQVYRGRGALEALGGGFPVRPGDVAFRVNFATVDEDMVVLDRRAGRIRTEVAAQLTPQLQNLSLSEHPEVKVFFLHTTEHRGALILRGKGLSCNVTDSDPGRTLTKVLEVKATDQSPEARKTAEIINTLTEKIHRILREHPLNRKLAEKGAKPANSVLFRGAGILPPITPITQLFHLKAACIGVTALVRGVSAAAGMELLNVEGATGTLETNAVAKAEKLVDNFQNFDFFFLHVKGADNASHDGNLKGKMAMIEKLDSMVKFLLNNLNLEETVIALTPDHTTPLSMRNHSGDPVPLTIAGWGVLADDVNRFSEKTCAKGGLGRIRGKDLMPILMNLAGRLKKFGV